MKLFHRIRETMNEFADEYECDSPTNEILKVSEFLYEQLQEINILPYKVAPTVEGGICFCFNNKDTTMYLELYNDGDIGYITANHSQKKTLENEDIGYDQIIEKLEKFYNKKGR